MALGREAGLNPSQIYRILENKADGRRLRESTINALARALQVTPSQVRDLLGPNVRVTMALTEDEVELITWYRGLDREARAEVNACVASRRREPNHES
ncbi:helix-turn-helix domain-containing protein [Nocardia puris]|uniref:helix-turn-helix domain-containing protein n=1 Tax=Nocardia puris TaxID=208602 RepID=UPI00082E9FFD|nr:helix-turn-helix transcriptional regulator [Nocardia puris]